MRDEPWPHAPWHQLQESGVYMITGATNYQKLFFHGAERLNLLEQTFFALAKEHQQTLHSWSIFPNHYHFISATPDGDSLQSMVKRFHTETSSWLRERDALDVDRVWFNFWDSRLTFEKSYLARLKYVHENPVHHGVARRAENYPWCSAGWSARTAPPSFYKTVMNFKVDQIRVKDDFEVPPSAYDLPKKPG